MSSLRPPSLVLSSRLTGPAAQKVDRLMARIQASSDLSFAQLVKLIEVLAADALELSVEDLAVLIEADPVVAAQVLKAANTYAYNPAGVSVSSVAQAVQVIGFTKIRMFGLSLLMMGDVVRRATTDEAQVMEAITLTSGIMAVAFEERQGGDQPDLAFLGAVLRSVSRMVLVGFLPEEYRQVAALAAETGDLDEAFRRHFGLSAVELSRELLGHANISRALRQSLQPVTPSPEVGASVDPVVLLTHKSDFMVRLTDLTLNPRVDAAQFASEARRMCESEGRQFGLEADELDGFLRHTEEQLEDFARMFDTRPLAAAINACLEARRAGQPIPDLAMRLRAGRPTSAGEAAGGAPGAIVDPTTSVPPRPAADVWRDALVRAAEVLAQPQGSVEAMVALVATAVAGGLAADEVLVLAADGAAGFKASGGSGECWSASRRQFGFRRDDRHPLAQAVNRGEVVQLADAAEPDPSRGGPGWIERDLQVRTAVMVPWGTATPASLVLFVGWRAKRPVSLPAEDIRALRALLALVQVARRMRGG